MNAEHPQQKILDWDLSQAIFMQHKEDLSNLMTARAMAKLQGPPTCTERNPFVELFVIQSVAKQVLNAHRELDRQCRIQASCRNEGG